MLARPLDPLGAPLPLVMLSVIVSGVVAAVRLIIYGDPERDGAVAHIDRQPKGCLYSDTHPNGCLTL
ncbi:hypothetical protein GCM10018952_45500 [Streptosporangium vulgare]